MRELDTKEAGSYSIAALLDAQRRNNNNRSHYSRQQRQQALTVRDLIDTAFHYSRLYINYRQKFIAIKAEGARAKDSRAPEVVRLFESNGYGVVSTQQGMIIRILRAGPV
jgi:hypothetical protein